MCPLPTLNWDMSPVANGGASQKPKTEYVSVCGVYVCTISGYWVFFCCFFSIKWQWLPMLSPIRCETEYVVEKQDIIVV